MAARLPTSPPTAPAGSGRAAAMKARWDDPAYRELMAVKAREGAQKANRQRWGPPRLVNLGDLTPTQRRLVMAMIEAAKAHAAAETKRAAPGEAAPETAASRDAR